MEIKRKINRILSVVVFVAITFRVFLLTTYLFRDYRYDGKHISEMKEEVHGSIDMVYIGGSAAFVYWQPLKAWNDCGFASYLMATNTLQAEMIKYYIEEVQNTQAPDLYVIDARPFQYWDQAGSESGIRNGSDSMKAFSPNRWKMINAYLSDHSMPENADALSFYLDIAKYHTNRGALQSPENWRSIDTQTASANKGWEWIDSYAYLDAPADFFTEKCASLPHEAISVLESLLRYCKSKDLKVLFVVCPYYITTEDQEKYNTVQKIVEENGFQFLNTNLYLEEMGIDYATDFYNKNHVNCFGAEKYTAFLEKFISENYVLPDHRGEAAYNSWDHDLERFLEEEKEHKARIKELQVAAEADP